MQHAWKVVTAFIGVFIAGSVFGGLFAMRLGQMLTERRAEAVSNVQLFNRYRNQLDLTEEQSTKLEPIIRRAETELTQVREAELKQSFDIVQRQHESLSAILTDDQKARLQTLEENMRRRGGIDSGRGRGGRGNGRGGAGGPGVRGGRGGRGGGAVPPGAQPPDQPPPGEEAVPAAPEAAPVTPPPN